jgi:peptidoglycan hydrolase-like protein with peptidoglycan-binding domain
MSNKTQKHPALGKGMVSDDVKEMQTLLHELKFLEYKDKNQPDGIYGKDTELAVIAFENSVKLNPDGLYGKQAKAAALEKLTIKHFNEYKDGGFITHEENILTTDLDKAKSALENLPHNATKAVERLGDELSSLLKDYNYGTLKTPITSFNNALDNSKKPAR